MIQILNNVRVFKFLKCFFACRPLIFETFLGVTSTGLRNLSRNLGSTLQLVNLGGPIEVPIEPEVIAECFSDLKEIASFGSYPFAGAVVAHLAGKNIRSWLNSMNV
jgi:hypothetical protein